MLYRLMWFFVFISAISGYMAWYSFTVYSDLQLTIFCIAVGLLFISFGWLTFIIDDNLQA